MKWMLTLSLANIKKKKVRTILTTLGVAIGMLSIISMTAVAKGAKSYMKKQMGGVEAAKVIMVYASEDSNVKKNIRLNTNSIKKMKSCEGVEEVYGEYLIPMEITLGDYTGYADITVLPDEIYARKEYTIDENGKKDRLGLIYRASLTDSLFNKSGWTSYYENVSKNMNDALGEKVKLKITSGPSKDEIINSYIEMVDNRVDSFSMDNDCIYGSQSLMRRYIDNKSEYSRVVVTVDNVDNVETVIKALHHMGFTTQNSKKYLDEMEKQFKIIEFVLGGIGMIALVVAVIGISNTMMTSVYDRMYETGLLKILGCDMDDIKLMFLIEAAVLGIIGGIVGVLFSELTGVIVNTIMYKLFAIEKGMKIYELTLKMIIEAVTFSCVLGMAAGYLPAKWTAKLKPLDALGNR